MCVSVACLGGCSSSKSGVFGPILALKSPHTSVTSYGWMLSSIYSTYDVASISNICRLDNDVVGGIYTLITFIL
jgi:hypothetical protein